MSQRTGGRYPALRYRIGNEDGCSPVRHHHSGSRERNSESELAVFEAPDSVFPDELLRPEKQDLACFVSGVDSIVEAQQRVAGNYFQDGSVEHACPPLKALIHIMAKGSFEGKTAAHPDIRAMFTREALLASDWYRRRLLSKQQRDIALWRRHVAAAPGNPVAHEMLARVESTTYVEELIGTIGADPLWGGPRGGPQIQPTPFDLVQSVSPIAPVLYHNKEA